MLRNVPSTTVRQDQHQEAGTARIREKQVFALEKEGWGSSASEPPATAPYKRRSKPEKETLVCPLCGNDNVVQAGIPFPDKDGGTSCYYQCQSDHDHRGCGYYDLKECFIPQKLLPT